MNQSTSIRPSIKLLTLGFLSSALGLLTIIFIVYLCLTTVAIFFTTVQELAQAEAEGVSLIEDSVLSQLGQSLSTTFVNGLRGIWDARLGFLLLGILGIFAAWAHQVGTWLEAKHVTWFSFGCMLLIIAITMITWTEAQREYLSLWIAESPEVFRWRDQLTYSYSTVISVSLIFALTITYPIWLIWHWWFRALSARFGIDGVQPAASLATTPAAPPAMSDHRAYAERLKTLRQGSDNQRTTAPSLAQSSSLAQTGSAEYVGFSPALQKLANRKVMIALAVTTVVSLLLLVPIDFYHQQGALRLQHERTFTNAETDATRSFQVTVDEGEGRIRVVNIKGLGTISIFLSHAHNSEDAAQSAVASIDPWTFEFRMDNYLYHEMSLIDVAPGVYTLHFIQSEGNEQEQRDHR
ncbi:MAG: hypothetical protein AAF639_24990, partial [Chloroflexota bacterium]